MKPSYVICFIVDRHHVSDSFESIAADIDQRCAASVGGVSARERALSITEALIRHRQNRRMYAHVMR